jgi:hypothetical protein
MNVLNMTKRDDSKALIRPSILLPAVQRCNPHSLRIHQVRHRAISHRLPQQTGEQEDTKTELAHLVDQPLAAGKQHLHLESHPTGLPVPQTVLPSHQRMRSQGTPRSSPCLKENRLFPLLSRARAPTRHAVLRPASIGNRNLAEARRPAMLARPKFQALASKHPQVITLPYQRAQIRPRNMLALQRTRPIGRTEMP